MNGNVLNNEGSMDIVNYLNLLQGSNNGVVSEVVESLEEDTVYALYKDKGYRYIDKMVSKYIFDVVTENILVNHYNRSSGRVLLKYKTTNKKQTSWTAPSVVMTYKEVSITDKQDVRKFGEDVYVNLLDYYTKVLVEGAVKELFSANQMLNKSKSLDTLEESFRYVCFMIENTTGVVTYKQLDVLKDSVLGYAKTLADKEEDKNPYNIVSTRKNRVTKNRGDVLHKRLTAILTVEDRVKAPDGVDEYCMKKGIVLP